MNKKERKATICVLSVVFLVPFMIGVVVGAKAFSKTTVETEYVTEYRYIYTEEQQPKIEYESLGVFEITAYCSCKKCCGVGAENRPKDENGNDIVYTATGAIARANHTIAVDPSVIPYGTKVIINGTVYTAEDCGGGIKGNRIDIYFDSHEAALQWGRQKHEVFVSK